jgi:hypothetical protein
MADEIHVSIERPGFYRSSSLMISSSHSERKTVEVDQIVEVLKKTFTMKELGELKLFLGMHVIWDRSKRSLRIS